MSTFTPEKPTAPGAYWIRGNGLERPYLVEVAQSENDGLLCNLHQWNTEPSFDYFYELGALSPDFEWLGPLEYCPDFDENRAARRAVAQTLEPGTGRYTFDVLWRSGSSASDGSLTEAQYSQVLQVLNPVGASVSLFAAPVVERQPCCVPTPEEKLLLTNGDYAPEELWGCNRPTCPKCINAAPPELAELQATLALQDDNLATLRAGTLAVWRALGVTDLSDALAKANELRAWEKAAREREAILQKLEGLFALLRRVVGEDKADGVEAAKELLKVIGGVE